MTALLFLVFVLITVAAAAQAVTGFGFVLVAVPFLALLTDPRTAVVAGTTLGLLVTALGWSEDRAGVDWGPVRAILAGAMVGIPLGLVIFTSLTTRTLQMLIGAVVLGFTALLLLRVRVPGGRPTQLVAGTVSGGMLATIGMTGPPLVLALQAAELPPRTFRATLQAALTLQSTVVVTGLVLADQLSSDSLKVVAVGIPALWAGWRIGDRVFRRLSAHQVRTFVLLTLVVSGTATMGQAFANR